MDNSFKQKTIVLPVCIPAATISFVNSCPDAAVERRKAPAALTETLKNSSHIDYHEHTHGMEYFLGTPYA